MYKKYLIMAPVLSLMTSGCASIVSGTDQDIAIHTNPEGAECILTREGQVLRKVTTPNTVRVNKLKHDIYVNCTMDGFHESTAHVNSGTQGSTFGNIILGGGIGWAIDSARGADNKYADVVTVTMVPLLQDAPDVVMIGVDGKQLTSEQVKDLKEKQAAAKATEVESGTVEEAETGTVEEAETGTVEEAETGTVEEAEEAAGNPPAMTDEHEKPEPEMPSEETPNPN